MDFIEVTQQTRMTVPASIIILPMPRAASSAQAFTITITTTETNRILEPVHMRGFGRLPTALKVRARQLLSARVVIVVAMAQHLDSETTRSSPFGSRSASARTNRHRR